MDWILYWNDVALEANRVSHTNGRKEQTGPPLSARALAIVHLAMYDALAAVAGNPADLPAYLPGLPSPGPGASRAAAVSAAAHATLSALFPSQRAWFDQRLSTAALSGAGVAAGDAFGRLVAKRVLVDRALDPGVGDDGYAPSLARGGHRADPDNPGQGFHAPFYGARSKLFAATARHGLNPPPALASPGYVLALHQVRRRGIAPDLMGTLPTGSLKRTSEQTVVGLFWAYDGAIGLGTPPRLNNQILRQVAQVVPNPATGAPNTEAQNARLFALVNVAMADAGILAWDQKYIYEFWRPVVGIREHDPSMGPYGTGSSNPVDDESQPDWLPLGAPSTNAPPETLTRNFTPPFPAYPSGHATFGASAFHVARLFYGVPAGNRTADNLFAGQSFVSEELNGLTRDNRGTVRPRHTRAFPDGLWQMIDENGRSRVYLGVHWIFDAFALGAGGVPDLSQNLGGVPLGLTIAEDIFAHAMVKSTVGPR